MGPDLGHGYPGYSCGDIDALDLWGEKYYGFYYKKGVQTYGVTGMSGDVN